MAIVGSAWVVVLTRALDGPGYADPGRAPVTQRAYVAVVTGDIVVSVHTRTRDGITGVVSARVRVIAVLGGASAFAMRARIVDGAFVGVVARNSVVEEATPNKRSANRRLANVRRGGTGDRITDA